MLRLLLLGSALAAPIHGAIFHWVGQTMNFDEPQNWMNGIVPMNASEIDFTSNQTFVTNMPTGVIQTGRIVFPRNGKFRFKSTGKTTIRFVKQAPNANSTVAVVAKFKGPRDEQGFHLGCGSNWVKRTASQTREEAVPADFPPCAADRIDFTSNDAYYMFSQSDDRMFQVQGMRYDGTTITPAALSALEFSQVKDRIKMVVSDDNCDYYDENGCFCPTSCPSEALAEEQAATIETSLAEKHQNAVDILEKVVNVTISVSLDPVTIGLKDDSSLQTEAYSPSDMDEVVFKDILESQLASFGAAIDTAAIELLQDPLTLSITMTASAKTEAFMPPGQATNVVSPFFINISQNAFTKPSSPLELGVQAAAEDFFSRLVLTNEYADIPTDNCSNASLCNDVKLAIITMETYFANMTAVLNSICPKDACLAEDMILTKLSSEFKLNSLGQATPSSVVTMLLRMIANTLGSVGLGAATSEEFLSAIEVNANTEKQVVGLKTVKKFGTDTLLFGESFSSARLYALINSDNYAAFVQAITSAYERLAPGRIDVQRVSVAITTTKYGDLALQITTDYSLLCVVNTTCDLDDSLIEPALLGYAAAFELEAPPCYSFITGWDLECLATQAFAWAKSNDASDSQTRSYIQNIIGCDARGKDRSGACYGSSDTVTEDTNFVFDKVQAAKKQEEETAASSGSSGSSGLDLPIIIGAAVGVLLLAAVIALLMRRGGSDSNSRIEAKDVRDTVAFSNPLYSEGNDELGGNRDGVHNPLYDGTAVEESFYDEPGAKPAQEPLYDEMSAAGAAYLDTAPAPSGEEEIAFDLDNATEFDELQEQGGGYLDVMEGEEPIEEGEYFETK